MVQSRLKAAGGPGWRRWGWAAASVALHAGLLAALVAATEEEGSSGAAATREEVTYVDISSFPPPPPPAAVTPTQPEPTPSRPDPRTPARPQPRAQPQTPPRATDIVEPELDSIPADPLGDVAPPEPIPAPVSSGPPGGEVRAGAQAGGQQGGVEGGRVGGEVGATGPPEGGTFVAAVVDRKAELRNRRELPRIMERLYPPVLRDAGVGGRVVVQFVVEPNGRVDMGSVKVMSADHDGLVDPTRQALREFRFTPAQMGDRKVRMLTQMPIVWQVEG